MQKPDGMIFPDHASLRICAIEDQSYKEQKINCKISNGILLLDVAVVDADAALGKCGCLSDYDACTRVGLRGLFSWWAVCTARLC